MMKVNHENLKKNPHVISNFWISFFLSTQLRKNEEKRLKRRRERERGGGGVKEYMLDPCYVLVSLLQNVSRDVT